MYFTVDFYLIVVTACLIFFYLSIYLYFPLQPNIIAIGKKALDEHIKSLTTAITRSNEITTNRRVKSDAKGKGAKLNKLDVINDALDVTGSNPCSQVILTDLDFDTELGTLLKQKPRMTELRRRSLKTEHCLQIVMTCDKYDDYDDGNGYDNNDTINTHTAGKYGINNQNNGKYDTIPPNYTQNNYSENYSDNNSSSSVSTETDERTKKIELAYEWQNSPYKIFVENLSVDVSEFDITQSLRNCGEVKATKFIKNDIIGCLNVPLPIVPPTEQDMITPEELYQKFGITTDMRPRYDARGGVRTVLLPKNPLAVISSVRRRPVKKTVVKVS